MARRELARYHDIAASAKTRGEGIGFAGVGIKLGLLASEEVVTETCRGKSHVATSWRLASHHRAPWRWVPPPGLVGEHGTAVRLRLRNPLSPLLDSGFLESALLRHFQPLFDPAFRGLLSEHYPGGIRFLLGGRLIEGVASPSGRAPLAVRLGRKRKPAAQGYLVREADRLAEDRQGLAVSTLGKVIKRGWDWLGLTPAEPDRVGGLIEVPALAECLTLNKADFIRSGPRGALYLACRKAIQETVSSQLAAWGDSRDALGEEARRRKTRPVERDVAAVLLEMAEDFPLLASLVEQRRGGQKRLPIGSGGAGPWGTARARLEGGAAVPARDVLPPEPGDGGPSGSPEAAQTPEPVPAPQAGVAPGGPADARRATEEPDRSPTAVAWPAGRGPRRPTRLGLAIQFESRPGDPGLGRLVESTVWVNEAHPAYRRAAASRSEGYHLALSVAMALAPLAVEPAEAHAFVTAFLARWGEAIDRPARRPKAPRRKRATPARGGKGADS